MRAASCTPHRTKLLCFFAAVSWEIEMSVIRFVLAIAFVFVSGISPILAAMASTEQPIVVSAVAPVYPIAAVATSVNGSVTVEVTIDAAGKPTLAKAVEGLPLLRKASEDAAIRWRFVPNSSDVEARVVHLIFIFSFVDWDAGNATLTPVFTLPYQVEVKHQITPRIDVNVSPRKRSRKARLIPSQRKI